MKIENIDVSSAINKIRNLLKKEKSLSPSFIVAIELLIKIITILLNQKNLNSQNSSIPPSKDPNGPKKKTKEPEKNNLNN